MRLLLLLPLLAILAGCGPIYETQYSYYPPASAEGRHCADQCKEMDRMCARNCKLEDQNCRQQARMEALAEFNRYAAEQRAHNRPVKKSVSDFEHYYQCSTSSCEDRCKEDYHYCFRNCGGEIRSREVCTMFCN